ncbi:unnamed protein product, partial [Choristocarpus tenellus]
MHYSWLQSPWIGACGSGSGCQPGIASRRPLFRPQVRRHRSTQLLGWVWSLVLISVVLLPNVQGRRFRGRGVSDEAGFVCSSGWRGRAAVRGHNFGEFRSTLVHEDGEFRQLAKTGKKPAGGNGTSSVLKTVIGRPHTPESRAKIGASNKGKKPWNIGKSRSDDVKEKIREGVRVALYNRRLAAAKSLNLTFDEYMDMKEKDRQQRKKAAKRGPMSPNATAEARAKISARLKERWRDPFYRAQRGLSGTNRTGITHSAETRARISRAVKAKWEDPKYRATMLAKGFTPEHRKKLSESIKAKWADPEYRKNLQMSNSTTKSEEHKRKISEKIKAKWADPNYRDKVVKKMREIADAKMEAQGGRKTRVRRGRVRGNTFNRATGRPRMEGTGPPTPAERLSMLRWEARRDAKSENSAIKLEKERARERNRIAREKKAREREEEKARIRKQLEEEERMLEGLDDFDALIMRRAIREK